jgi:hypothetical protein
VVVVKVIVVGWCGGLRGIMDREMVQPDERLQKKRGE